MTKNQIEYNKLLESKRAAQAQERLTAKRDAAKIEYDRGSLEETRRKNRRGEEIQVAELAEAARTHKANESIGRGNLGLGYASLDESSRAARASEAQRSAEINLKGRTQSEVERSNRVRESETARSNIAKESETNRANKAREGNERARIIVDAASAASKIAGSLFVGGF